MVINILLNFGITNISIDKYSFPSCILTNLIKNHLILTNVIVFASLENIYLEQGYQRHILEWDITTFLTFQHHVKISSNTRYFHGTAL